MFPAGRGRRRIPKTNLVYELPGKIAVGFILIANDRWLTDIGNLQTDDAIAIETHELDLVRSLAVDPFLKGSLPIDLTHLLVRLAYSFQNHLAVHTDQNFVVQNRTLQLGGQGVCEGLRRGLEREIDHGNDQGADLRSGHFRDEFVEDQGHPGTDRDMAVVSSQGHIATHASNGNMLQDVMMLLGAVIKFE